MTTINTDDLVQHQQQSQFDDAAVDSCIEQHYVKFLEQAMHNVRRKHPFLSPTLTRIVAEKMIVIVQENFKLNNAMAGRRDVDEIMDNRQSRVCGERHHQRGAMDVDNESLLKRCLVGNMAKKLKKMPSTI